MELKESTNLFKKIMDAQPVNTTKLKQEIVRDLNLSYHMIQRYCGGKIKKMNPIVLMRIADYLNKRFYESAEVYTLMSFYE
jgi:hypothetical protein